MASASKRTQLWWKRGTDRRFQLHLPSVAICLLSGFAIGSFVCMSGVLAGRSNAAEPQSSPNVALQGDGRFLGYTRLREGTSVPAILGTVVALGPRRWAFVPAAAPPLEAVQSVKESESVKITSTQQSRAVTRRVDSVTLSTKVPITRDGGERRRGDAAVSVLQDAGKSEAGEKKSERIVLIAENLMLQRIVQAIREDELDSLWTVTGRVTEYFGENRLTILTAQRGQAKQLSPAAGR